MHQFASAPVIFPLHGVERRGEGEQKLVVNWPTGKLVNWSTHKLMFTRKNTKTIKIGNVTIGGGNPVAVQSMTNTDTHDVRSTIGQIRQLEDSGCRIVRVSAPDMEAAKNIEKIKKGISIPLVADIHFDSKLAVEAINRGADKIRINPGNIGSRKNVEDVVLAAKKAGIPIRIGVNSGSLKKFHSVKSSGEKARVLVDAVLEHIKILESLEFFDTVVALKASDVVTTIEAYRLFARRSDYPLHIGVTEAGGMFRGTIKSSVGLGVLLCDGIGDTMRVSLTADPLQEVRVGYHILQSLGLGSTGIEIVSCPTCSRCGVNLEKIVNAIEDGIGGLKVSARFYKKPLKVAVMGCVVNGPGEAKDADIGIAGGKGFGLLFKGGEVVRKVKPKDWVKTIVGMIKTAAR